MDEFLEACGASGPLRFRVEESPWNASEGKVASIELPFAIAGRDAACDVPLDSIKASLQHVFFQLVNGRLFFLDLGSRGGLVRGGVRCKSGWLARDEALDLGPCRIRFQGGDAPGDAAPTGHDRLAFEDPRVQDALGLELAHRGVRRTSCEVRWGAALIGSGDDCPIRLVDASVADHHAILIRTPVGAWVVGLSCKGGLRLNGQEVRHAKLAEGDAIQLGSSVIRLTKTASAPKPEEPASVSIAPPVELTAPAPPASNGHVRELGGVDDTFVFGSRRAASVGVETQALSSSHSSMILKSQAMELIEEVLAPMVRQIGVMQEQMVSEFHQARAALYETFTTLHQEQSATFQHELDQLRELAQELTRLHANLARQPAPSVPEAASSSHRLANGPANVLERELRADGPSALKKAPVGPSALLLEAIALERAAPASVAPDATPRVFDENVHNQLCDRIVQNGEGQQGPWRKLLSLLPGAAANGRG
jgi:pSer/pThr/pTyr-binding forkhead associated (FHA) protein